jgi:hypothetical protein
VYYLKTKRKAILVTGRGVHRVVISRGSPHFRDKRFIDSGEIVSLTLRPPPRKIPGTISVKG